MSDNKIGNPGPIGLMGFGMTTILLNIHNAGFTALDGHILGMGIFVGGIAQVIAGSFEIKKGNTFAGTAFTLYGFFWIALVYMLKYSGGVDPASLGTYLLVWGLFSTYMFIGTFKLNKALQVVFGTLVVLFALLVIDNYLKAAGLIDAGKLFGKIAGYVGIICGGSAFYVAMAEILNEVYGKTVLPLGPVKK